MQINAWAPASFDRPIVDLLLNTMTAWCGDGTAWGGVILGLFVSGLVGGPVHCVPMCGGFVMGQVADRMAATPGTHLCEWRRVGTGALLPYQLGRLTTYAVLGAIAGAAGHALASLPWFGWLSGALLLMGAALFLMQALRRLVPRLALHMAGAPASWYRVFGPITHRIDRTTAGGGYQLGVLLGFLPCGLLYAALAVAASAGGATSGALGMMAFAVGTAPSLMVLGIAGHLAGRRWQAGVIKLAPAVLLLNALLLAALAVRGLA
jgi:uncharacterized protein